MGSEGHVIDTDGEVIHVPRAYVPTKPCARTKSDGTPCLRAAVTYTRYCQAHGGTSPGIQKAAMRARTAELVSQYGLHATDADAITDPFGGLAQMAGVHRRLVDLIASKMNDNDLLADRDLLGLWQQVTRDLTRLLESMARIGIDASRPAMPVTIAMQSELAVLLMALTPYPEARVAAAEALGMLA